MINTKQCSRCKEVKPLTEFHKDKNRKDGLRSACKSCRKQHYETNKEKIAEQKKQHYEANKEKIAERINRYRKERRSCDPVYRLRRNTSNSVHRALKSQEKQKGSLTFEHLPYTPKELKEHIESLWEPWMDWDNYGPISKNKRTWQMDHIIPQSHLIYDSLQHPNFQKCWALSNLRPICSWENLEKGVKLLTEEK
jgi:tRNA nucleotidyltransferase/poly(A) polymerase